MKPRPMAELGQTCPVCGRKSFLFRYLDRYFHDDGSDNRECWLNITAELPDRSTEQGRRQWSEDDE